MINLCTESLFVSYGNKMVLNDIDIKVLKGKVVSIIGPNGSGKSTLLKAISRLLNCDSGRILINGDDLKGKSRKEISKKMAFLLQRNTFPKEITVDELMKCSRVPYLKWYESLKDEDMRIIEEALKATNALQLKDKKVASLSGGECQRIFLSMAIAQNTEILLFDEPTTYLDLGYQLEFLELTEKLKKEKNKTIIMVLHDLNQAARFSDYMYLMDKGKIKAFGKPSEVITVEMLKEVYKIEAEIITKSGYPLIIPLRSAG